MNDLIINESVKSRLNNLVKNAPHAVLLSGSTGVGLKTIAQVLTASIAQNESVITISPDDKGTISIETIRELYRMSRSTRDKKVILIDDADAMGHPAQNALLKLLEEPSSNTHFVLTTHKPQVLLPTVLSRVQTIEIPPISKAESQQNLKDAKFTPVQKQQVLFLASGRPAEITRLVQDETYRREQLFMAELTKKFLLSTRPEQLEIINSVTGKRDTALNFIDMMLKMSESQLVKVSSNDFLDYLDKLLIIKERLRANGHVRSQLLLSVK